MIVAADKFGPLADPVATAGAIIAASVAIGLAWRRRAKWEPSEEDIPRGGQRVGALIAGIAIALMYAEWRAAEHIPSLNKAAIVLGGLTLVALLVYAYLVNLQTYKVVGESGPPSRVIGGFWLTSEARESKRQHHKTTQELLAGAAYDVEKLWSRHSRGLAKLAFLVCYLALTVCGTVALTAAAIRLELA